MRQPAMFWEKNEGEDVRCFLCAHNCRIKPEKFGICGVRQNLQGKLYSLVYGEPIAAHLDPIEKKPLYHFLPGSSSYSVATVGCNFRCGFCQNWQISQLDKKAARAEGVPAVTPEEIIEQALFYNAASISYTYTEPTIFFEYAYDIAQLAHEKGLANIFVTNGFMGQQALEKIQPFLNAANVDLKSFNPEFYRRHCSARLEPVLDTIRRMKKMDIWVELTTLVIPGLNDSEKELNQIAAFIAQVDRHMPWHISRFHPDYHFNDYAATPVPTLHRAKQIGEQHGLKYIYIGNVADKSDTVCPQCGKTIIQRPISRNRPPALDEHACPQCQMPIVGVWELNND